MEQETLNGMGDRTQGKGQNMARENYEDLMKNHIETYHCCCFLKYIHIQKEFKWSYPGVVGKYPKQTPHVSK